MAMTIDYRRATSANRSIMYTPSFLFYQNEGKEWVAQSSIKAGKKRRRTIRSGTIQSLLPLMAVAGCFQLQRTSAWMFPDVLEVDHEDGKPPSAFLDSLLFDQATTFQPGQDVLPPPNCTTYDSAGLATDDDGTGAATHGNSNHQLECFLWKLQVTIPSQSFKKDFITIDIHDMICTHFRIMDLQSGYQPSSSPKSSWCGGSVLHDGTNNTDSTDGCTSFWNLSVGQLSATCKGRYHATGGLSGKVEAAVKQQDPTTAADRNESAIQVTFAIFQSTSTRTASSSFGRSDSRPLQPKACQTQHCLTHLHAPYVRFSGSISAKLIQLFAKVVSKYISNALQESICPLLQKQIDPLVTAYLKKFNVWADQYLPSLESTVSELPLHLPSTTTAITTSPGAKNSVSRNVMDYGTIQWVLEVFNQQLEYHLQTGWLPLHWKDDDAFDCRNIFRGLSGWWFSIFGNTSQVKLPSYFQNIELLVPIEEFNVNASIGLHLPHFSIVGLDTMDHLQLLSPTPTWIPSRDGNGTILDSNGTLNTALHSSTGFFLTIPAFMTVNLTSTLRRTAEGTTTDAIPPLQESFRVSINVTNVEIAISSMLRVVDWEGMSLLQVVNAIQSFIESRSIGDFANLIRTVNTAQVSEWIASMVLDSIVISRSKSRRASRSSDITSTLEQDIDEALNNALRLATREYTELWTLLISGIVKGPGKLALNKFVREWIEGHGTEARPFLNTSLESSFPSLFRRRQKARPPNLVNFTKWELMNKFNRFLEYSRTMRKENHFLRCLGHVVSFHHIEKGISVSGISAENWDSLDHLQLLKPLGDLSLGSSLQIGMARIVDSIPSVTFTIDVDGPSFLGQVNVTAFGSFAATVDAQIEYDLSQLENLTVAHALQQPQCTLLPAKELRLLPEATTIRLGDAGVNISASVNDKRIAVSTVDYPGLHDIATAAIDWLTEWMRTISNKAILEWIGLTFATCPGIVIPDGNSSDSDNDGSATSSILWRNAPLLSAFLVLLVLLQGGLLWVAKTTQPSHDTPLRYSEIEEETTPADDGDMRPIDAHIPLLSRYEELMGPFPNEILKNNHSQDYSILNDVHLEFNDFDDPNVAQEHQLTQPMEKPVFPLFSTPQLSETVRFMVPIMLLGTIALMISSNISVGASVDLLIYVNEKSFLVPGLFEFSLANTTTELYQAGVFLLLVFVVVFSGIWPYVKLIWLVRVWMVPASSQHQRERQLLLFDAMGKWSLVDSFVLILFVVAFRFHLHLNDNFGFDVHVIPKYGFYSFLFGTCSSLCLGHFVLLCHRFVSEDWSFHATYHRKESVFGHAFEAEQNSLPRHRVSKLFQFWFLSCILLALTLLSWGFVEESFSFTFGGLAGHILGPERRTAIYSVFGLGAAIPYSIGNSGSVGVVFLQGSYFFFTVVMPVACLLLLLPLMVLPLSLNPQRILLIAVEVTNAWSAIEVFMLSLLVALFQISTFADFMVGDKCDLINQLAAEVVGGNDELAGVCFSVEASVKPNCYYLLFGATLYTGLVSFSLRMAHVAMDERLAREAHEDTGQAPHFRLHRHRSDFLQRIHGASLLRSVLLDDVEGPELDTTQEMVAPLEHNEEHETCLEPAQH